MSDLFDGVDEELPVKAEKGVPARKVEKKFGKTLMVIDGYSLIYRSYYAHISRPLTDDKGHNISAYFGFFSSLMSLLSEFHADYIAVAMDERHPTFRHGMYPEYKATRPKTPEDLHAQIPLISQTLEKMGISVLSRQGYEADDVIASLAAAAEKNGIDTAIVTSDKDLMQLVSAHVYVLRPAKKETKETGYTVCREKEVFAEYGVKPRQIVDYLSILGDSADNVPGVKGIGEKGAAKLLAEYVTLEGVYRHLDSLPASTKRKLEEGRDDAELSKSLIVLSRDALEEGFSVGNLAIEGVNLADGADDFLSHGCIALAKRLTGMKFAETKESLLLDGDYRTIRASEAFSLISDSRIAIAIAATSQKPDARMIGLSFTSEKGKGYYIPVSAENIEEVKKLFMALSGKSLIVHDAKSAIHAIRNLGIEAPSFDIDTMIISWLLDSDWSYFDLETVYRRVLEDDRSEKKRKSEEDQGLVRACDADKTLRLALALEPALDEQGFRNLYETMERPLIGILADMEREGMHIDLRPIRAMDNELEERLDSLSGEIQRLAGKEFNISSSTQMAKILYDDLGYPRPDGGKSSSVRADVLQSLLPEGGRLIEAILEYRASSTLRNTFTTPIQKMVDGKSRIHTTFLQTGTATGRLSSKEPNLQNMPVRTDDGRRIRSAYTPKEGTLFLSADYSQIELVVLAHLSQDAWLLDAFSKGLDIHRFTAGMIFSKDLRDITPDERRIAKTINFGIIYGMSAYGVSADLGISRSDAAVFRKKYLERYTGVRTFIDRIENEAKDTGYVYTMHGHRRKIENKLGQRAEDRMAVNTVIQGSAAEIVKRAMIRVSRALREKSMETKLILQIHDELIFEVPFGEKEAAEALVRSAMEERLSVPLSVSVEFGRSWGEIH